MHPVPNNTFNDEKDNCNNSNAQYTPARLIASNHSIGSTNPHTANFLTGPLRRIIWDYLDLDNEELLNLVYLNNLSPNWLVDFANANLDRVISELMTANPSLINNAPDSSIDNLNLNAAYTKARFSQKSAKIIVANVEKESTEEKDEKTELQQCILAGIKEDVSGNRINTATRLLLANYNNLPPAELAAIQKQLQDQFNTTVEEMRKLNTLSAKIAGYAALRSCQPFAIPNHRLGYLQRGIGILGFIAGIILVATTFTPAAMHDNQGKPLDHEDIIRRRYIGIGLMLAIVLLINCLKSPVHKRLNSLPGEIQEEVENTLTDVYEDTSLATVQDHLQEKIAQQSSQQIALERALAACAVEESTEQKRPHDDIVITVPDSISVPVVSINDDSNLDSKQITDATTPLLSGKTSYPPDFFSGNRSNRKDIDSSSVTPVRDLHSDYQSMGDSEAKTCSLRPTSA